MIHKSGDETQPSNWRPISLQPTIFKIFAAVMARRLASWEVAEGKLSPSQGFLPTEGCVEHSFTMESVLTDSKRRRRDLRILWLDLKNAFGTVPHDRLWWTMDRLQMPVPFEAMEKEPTEMLDLALMPSEKQDPRRSKSTLASKREAREVERAT